MPSDDLSPLRVFVAMPGTDLGPDAIWKSPQDVRSFYEKVGKALAARLGREVEVIVEREKSDAGVIHRSMFDEALKAEVFLADLTGKNANVFFELGVRYALRRHVTIPVSQHTAGLPFNIGHMRAVEYANRPDDIAIEKLVDLIASGLESRHNDSPVRDVLDVEVVDRALWEKISGTRSAALLRAADREEQLETRLRILREAVESAPRDVGTRLRLATELRKAASFTEALAVVSEGIRIDPAQGAFYQERGLALGKLGKPEDLRAAADALRHAVRLEPENREFLANLGGALRRVAVLDAPKAYDESVLREALDCYLAAARLAPYDTYPALNVARLRLLLSRFDDRERQIARDRLQRLEHLCAYEAAEQPTDYWRAFDLADVRLLLGRVKSGLEAYAQAIDLVPRDQRESILGSPRSALFELLAASVLAPRVRRGVERAIALLDQKRSPENADGKERP